MADTNLVQHLSLRLAAVSTTYYGVKDMAWHEGLAAMRFATAIYFYLGGLDMYPEGYRNQLNHS